MTECTIGCICLIAEEVDLMADFYSHVFGLSLTRQVIDGRNFYEGKFSGMDFVLVPADPGKVNRAENKVHFDIYVKDIHRIVALAEKHGGKTNGRLMEDDNVTCIGVFDPDGNFMAVKQRK
jgi:predicted enzyme related to lactoylglutathione lyase